MIRACLRRSRGSLPACDQYRCWRFCWVPRCRRCLTCWRRWSLGFLGYGLSLVLFIVALRQLGAARTGAYFATAPFIGAAAAMFLYAQSGDGAFWLAATCMGVGVWLHVTENHVHEHVHSPLSHSHPHTHDEHHRHEHAFGLGWGRAPYARACARMAAPSAHAFSRYSSPAWSRSRLNGRSHEAH